MKTYSIQFYDRKNIRTIKARSQEAAIRIAGGARVRNLLELQHSINGTDSIFLVTLTDLSQVRAYCQDVDQFN